MESNDNGENKRQKNPLKNRKQLSPKYVMLYLGAQILTRVRLSMP